MRYLLANNQEGSHLLCAQCFAETHEESLKREWFHYSDLTSGIKTLLPVLYHYMRCKNCGHTDKDERAAIENRSAILAFKRANAHFWTPGEQSFCVTCGIANPIEEAESRGLFDADSGAFAPSKEGRNAQWICSRINIFGCHINHPTTLN